MFPGAHRNRLKQGPSFVICAQEYSYESNLEFFSEKRLSCSTMGNIAPQGEKEKYIWESTALPVETVVHQTIPEVIWSNMGQWGDLVAFECGLTGRRYTHAQIFEYSRGFGASLLQSGLQKDDVVSIFLCNCPEYPIVLLGILEAGFVVSPVSPSSTSYELASQLKAARAKRIVASDQLLPVVTEALCAPELSECQVIYVSHGAYSEGPNNLFEQMIHTDWSATDFLKGTAIDAREKLAFIPFSSGSTGPPKGVMLTHSNVATNLLQYARSEVTALKRYEEMGQQEIIVGVLPFCHAYALTCILLTTLYLGAHCVTLPKCEPNNFVMILRKFRFTCAMLVTPLLNFINKSSQVTEAELGSLRSIMLGAAPVGSAIIGAIKAKTGPNCEYIEGYGMTELSPVSHVTPPGKGKLGSMGKLVPSTRAKIINPETMETLGANEIGELCIAGPQVMKGYLENEKATIETIDSEGFLRTGDLGYVDDEGYFYIVDRLKELIKVKGLQVAPSELENLIREVPGVADVAVIGVPHDAYGEVPRAYIVRGGGQPEVRSEDISNYLSARLARHKQLAGGVEFVDVIPKAPSGKILRRELKRAYMEHEAVKNESKNGEEHANIAPA